MVDDWVIKTMYATKRRRKNTKMVTTSIPGVGFKLDGGAMIGGGGGSGMSHASASSGNAKSNPSKRHRERLNAELEHLASLLPFEQAVIAKLDKLSILRLAVSYLRMKGYFQALSFDHPVREHRLVSHLYQCPIDMIQMEGETSLQALNGFIFIVSCDGEVFSVCKTVKHYLGFHQSDILHQSVMELIHSEDREVFQKQLSWQAMLPPEHRNLTLNEVLSTAYCHLLQRCFTVRFRCLLDNTSGFITLEISGRLQFLHGHSRNFQMSSTSSRHSSSSSAESRGGSRMDQSPSGYSLSSFGLFGVCSPLGSLPSLDGSQRETSFKTKHKMDLTFTSMDTRARKLFKFTGKEDSKIKVYDLIHPDDLQYVAEGHREVCKLDCIGLLAHRWLSMTGHWIWLQSRLKVSYKDNKQDHIVAIHRRLEEAEGNELYYRRNAEYKLPFPLLEPETLLSDDDMTETVLGSEPLKQPTSPTCTTNTETNFMDETTLEKETGDFKMWEPFAQDFSDILDQADLKPDPQRGPRKIRGQLKNYLQTTRRRKPPYKPTEHKSSRITPAAYSNNGNRSKVSSNTDNGANWYSYRNLFGRSSALGLLGPGMRSAASTTDYSSQFSQNYQTACSYNYPRSYMSCWDFEGSQNRIGVKSDDKTGLYSGMMQLTNEQQGGFNYKLPISQISNPGHYSAFNGVGGDYHSAYEAYSAAVAAAAVVAAASGQSQNDYGAQSMPVYDGSVRVIRSLNYQDSDDLTSHSSDYALQNHYSTMAKMEETDMGIISKLALSNERISSPTDLGEIGESVSALRMLKSDGRGDWFSNQNVLNQLPQQQSRIMGGDEKQMPSSSSSYSLCGSSIADQTSRDISWYLHESSTNSLNCENIFPWTQFESKASCIGETSLCEVPNYQLGFTATT